MRRRSQSTDRRPATPSSTPTLPTITAAWAQQTDGRVCPNEKRAGGAESAVLLEQEHTSNPPTPAAAARQAPPGFHRKMRTTAPPPEMVGPYRVRRGELVRVRACAEAGAGAQGHTQDHEDVRQEEQAAPEKRGKGQRR
jgi:hypothetical protein